MGTVEFEVTRESRNGKMEDIKQKRRRRTPLSQLVRDEVLREAGYMCANPRCRHILTLHIHHIVWVKEGGSNDPNNLVALCPNCHTLHTQGYIPAEAIKHWKGILHALNNAFNKESLDLLLFLYSTSEKIWYSGDGVLKFAGLIAADFAEIIQSQSGRGLTKQVGGAFFGYDDMMLPPGSAHRLALTEKGRAFIESWMTGDEAGLRSVTSSHSSFPRNLAPRSPENDEEASQNEEM